MKIIGSIFTNLTKLTSSIAVFFISIIAVLLLLTYCSILNEKMTIELDAKQDSNGDVIVFSPELEEDDYIWEYSIGVFKNGTEIKQYDLYIKCQYKIADCIKEVQNLQPDTDKKIVISSKSEIIFPKEIAEKGAVSVSVRTTKYERQNSHFQFCIKNNKLLFSNTLDMAQATPEFIAQCVPEFRSPQQRSASQ